MGEWSITTIWTIIPFSHSLSTSCNSPSIGPLRTEPHLLVSCADTDLGRIADVCHDSILCRWAIYQLQIWKTVSLTVQWDIGAQKSVHREWDSAQNVQWPRSCGSTLVSRCSQSGCLNLSYFLAKVWFVCAQQIGRKGPPRKKHPKASGFSMVFSCFMRVPLQHPCHGPVLRLSLHWPKHLPPGCRRADRGWSWAPTSVDSDRLFVCFRYLCQPETCPIHHFNFGCAPGLSECLLWDLMWNFCRSKLCQTIFNECCRFVNDLTVIIFSFS